MKKKILHISPDFNYSCGVSKLVFLYLKYFCEKDGYEVHFITNGGDSLERLKEIPELKFDILKFSKGLNNFLYQKKFFNEIKNYVIKHNIGLIHTHHRFPEFIAAKLAKSINLKTITSAHSFVKGFKKISFKSDKIIAVSEAVKSHIKNNFDLNGENIITIYNPVENFSIIDSEELRNLKSTIGIEPGHKILLFVGKINEDKGSILLLNSLKMINKQRKDVFLLMCGSLHIKNFKKRINGSNIKLLEPRKHIQLLYQIADVVVLPSRVDSFPFIMLEAGLFSKPFIGGKTGGIAEFIEDWVDGLLVNPYDENELSEKILFLLNNKEVAEKLDSNLYKKIKDKCDYNAYFRKLESIYNSLLVK